GRKYIGGKVTILGQARAEKIKFHAVGLSVDSVSVNGEKADFSVKDGVLTLFKVPRSDLRVEVGYHGSLNENMQGAYLSTYEYQGETETIVATQFESHYAREAFPCIDEPAAKAVFELSITVPEGDDMVIANTPEMKTALGSRSDSLKTITFEPTPRMSTYLLAFVIGKFHGKTIVNKHGTEITTYCALNQELDSVDFANEVAARSLEFYDDNFKVPYPLVKLDQVALPDFEAGAMENWGLVTYRESMMLASKNATLSTKKSVALTVAHELSHQWFGDLVTMKWWDDLWLNESFASVMEYFAVDEAYPEFKIFEGFFTGDAYAALKRDAYNGVQSVHQEISDPAEIATLFDGAIVYSKGARLMLMLIRLMGWEKFCAGIHEYFEKFKYQNTVGDDLWASLEPYAEFKVSKMMHTFIDRPGYPVLEGLEPATQRRFLIDGKMEKSSWLLPKISEDMSGHYILDLSEEEFQERLGKFAELGLEEKLRILIDRSLVTRTELASSASLIPLLLKFEDENSAAVWNILLSIITNLKVFFEPESEDEKKFKKFVLELIEKKLDEIGLETREEDDENVLRLRSILLALDFYAEDEERQRKLAEKYETDFSKIDSEIRNDVFDAKVYFEAGMVTEYIQRYQEVADPEIKYDLLFAATLTKDAEKIEDLIRLLKRPEIVKPQDQFYLFIYLYRNFRAQKKVFAWLKENWDYVKEISGDKSLDNYPRYIANSIRTEEDFKEYREFFEAMRNDPALSRAIEIGESEIQARLELIKEDKEAVVRTLGNV
ncbi:M1 family metallopeptidase, partial [Candidatus Saccharibacteria bacterium]|nr:M1 family metallopeptidase [Candidatus Saccharibacteria bacterium]